MRHYNHNLPEFGFSSINSMKEQQMKQKMLSKEEEEENLDRFPNMDIDIMLKTEKNGDLLPL